MLKQLEIFRDLVSNLKKDSTVESVMLTGSVAVGTATALSDLDMIVLGQKNAFVSQTIDDVVVEIYYITFDNAVKKLDGNPMEAYRYLDAKIEYDNGNAREIIAYAENILERYRVPKKAQAEIAYWLRSVEWKLESAFSKQDMLFVSYLVATNTWKVLEGIWTVNQKPIPPSGYLYRRHTDLDLVPCQDWFEGLFAEDVWRRGRTMITCIDWILKILNTH